MPRKVRAALLLTPVLLLVGFLAVRHDGRQPLQRFGEYEARRQVDRWYVFGREVYAYDRLGIFPSFKDEDIRHGEAPLSQYRLCGIPVGGQDDEFGLGDPNDDRTATIRYILRAKMRSPPRRTGSGSSARSGTRSSTRVSVPRWSRCSPTPTRQSGRPPRRG